MDEEIAFKDYSLKGDKEFSNQHNMTHAKLELKNCHVISPQEIPRNGCLRRTQGLDYWEHEHKQMEPVDCWRKYLMLLLMVNAKLNIAIYRQKEHEKSKKIMTWKLHIFCKKKSVLNILQDFLKIGCAQCTRFDLETQRLFFRILMRTEILTKMRFSAHTSFPH